MNTTAASTAYVAFSALFAESDDYLSTFIMNFVINTNDACHLFVNFPSGREVPEAARKLSPRVHLFSGTIARRKVGHTLLCGHLESFAEASRILERFDYFCTTASNSLFVRPFDLTAVRSRLPAVAHSKSMDIDDMPDRWWWSRIKKCPDAFDYMKYSWDLKRVCANQIEGLFADKTNWQVVYDNLANIIEFGSKFHPDLVVPIEEIIPSTLFDRFGTREYLNICHNLWGRGADQPATIADLLEFSSRYPDEICMLKWFDRTSDSAATAAVSTEWIATFLRSLPRSDTMTAGERLKYRSTLDSAAQFLKQGERSEALTSSWGPTRSAVDQQDLTAAAAMGRQSHAVVVLMREEEHDRPLAYVYKEPNVPGFDISVIIQSTGSGVTVGAHLSETTVHEERDTTVDGYVYLACPPTSSIQIIRIRLPHTSETAISIVPGKVTLRNGPNYGNMTSILDESARDHQNLYYRVPADPSGTGNWIGIPFKVGKSFTVHIDVLH